jgi:sortase B
LNQDFFGWLSIPGTSIDYPVMYTPCDPEYYIDKDFNRSRDANGTLFLDGLCIPEYSNLILYGHNMKSGRMFGTLEKFKDKSYYEEHPIIRFDTLEQQGTYEIFAVFITEVYTRDSNEFKFYDYTELSTRADFDIFMENIRNLRLYDTEVEAQYGDRFLTLATCDYSRDNGRFVVVAKKIGNCP